MRTALVLGVAGCLTPGTISAQVATPPGLVGWWQGESDVGDSIADNDGQLVNGASVTPGLIGNAFSLDGLDDYVAIPDDSSLDFGEAAFTWEMWFRTTQSTPGVMFTKFDGGVPFTVLGDYVALVMAGGNLEIRFRDTDGQVTFSALTAIPCNDGGWHHVAAVRVDSANALLYVDGVQAAQVANMANVDLTTDGDLLMGAFRYTPGIFGLWGGQLDEVSVYDRALSVAEIGAIFAAGAAGKGVDTDGDGLADGAEASIGTDPNDPDTDGDGLLDGTEVDMQTATGLACTDPLDPDSDDDTLLDGFEVALDMDPCDPDTDGDTLPDAIDPTPTDPVVTSGVLDGAALGLADYIESRDLSLFEGPNDNARRGRRNSMANCARNAAKGIGQNHFASAIALLEVLGACVDDEPERPDWMPASNASGVIQASIGSLISLLQP